MKVKKGQKGVKGRKVFVKGDSRINRGGRPKGKPNLATREIKELGRALTFGDPTYIDNAVKRMRAGEAPHLEKFLVEHGYGKPVERTEQGGPGDFDPGKATDAELKARMLKAAREL